LNWKQQERLKNVFHIHGEADRIFPCTKVHPDIVVRRGGHLMVYDHPGEISRILSERINSIND
jgi:hypothetical protein